MKLIYIILSILNLTTFCFVPNLKRNIYYRDLFMNKEPFDLNYSWKQTSKFMKKKARDWFIKRAEKSGIKWNELKSQYSTPKIEVVLNLTKSELENKTIEYPDYFLKPFHGYDEGNMNWLAAKEGDGATISMSVNYWKNVKPEDTEIWLRGNYTNTIQKYIVDNNLENHSILNILDIGCSFGIGTEFINDYFKNSQLIGLDLSPYFVSLANYRSNKNDKNITYVHANAEEIPLPSNSLDIITAQFLFHEVPTEPTRKIVKEVYRVLKPNGVLSIIDLDPQNLRDTLEINVFRKWAFEVTEPHIYEYYKSNMTDIFLENGFKNIRVIKNDPLNKVWLGRK